MGAGAWACSRGHSGRYLDAGGLPELGKPRPRTNADRYATAEDAVEFIAANRLPGDRVFVHSPKGTSALALWYGPRAGLRPDGVYTTATGAACRDVPGVVDQADARRVWLLRVNWGATNAARKAPERAAFSGYGRLVGERWFDGVVVLLYAASPGVTPSPTAPCLVILPFPG